MTEEEIKRADIILWKGYCHVHAHFKPEDVDRLRQEHPDAVILVHPECVEEVVDGADAIGSTSFIARFVQSAPKGTKIAIGTEIHLISRLARDHPDKIVFPIKRSLCGNMFKISLHDLLYTLDHLDEGVNLITIPEDIRQDARLALERMLQIS
ncbi:MAG: quinolinate synthase NadA [Armatimonadota bacterium]|nr:quinolinate synthase NadA [Armatimonadota bacterium]